MLDISLELTIKTSMFIIILFDLNLRISCIVDACMYEGNFTQVHDINY